MKIPQAASLLRLQEPLSSIDPANGIRYYQQRRESERLKLEAQQL